MKLLPLLLVSITGAVLAWFVMRDEPTLERPAGSPQAEPEPTRPATPATQPKPPQWQGEKPLVCSGDARHTLKGATIGGQGGLIRASGKCQVTLDRCTIEGRSIGVQDGASLTITGGRLEDTLVSAKGQSRLTLKNVELRRNTYALRLQDEAQATIEGGNVVVKHSPAVRVDDHGRLSLQRGTVTGGVEARDESVIIVAGGSLALPAASEPDSMLAEMRSSRSAAIRVYDTAVVALQNVTVTGPVDKVGGEILELKPGDDAEAIIQAGRELAARLRRYERNGCQGFIACYTDHGSNGKVDVHVVVPIGPDGKAVGARVMRAVGANPKTRACLQKTASERFIDGFEGPPGALECAFGGTIQGGTQMLSFSIDYVPKEGPPPPALPRPVPR